ncbi:hypothetical protein HYH03_008661 [Edaphochlamys debaryana]|uniref:Uncharacterized protein n=1 Tax=Edaphochlamys debaryana TaxID=47281 RepID=A0A835Y0I1_9CHLO|nr:hypothetical protein HYH03_008661 [Edaphochlamys debaryana]|eukprot:KAG2492997.1 hypothetical protein HYH03_008661 [Edaphochlamys debaryana]
MGGANDTVHRGTWRISLLSSGSVSLCCQAFFCPCHVYGILVQRLPPGSACGAGGYGSGCALYAAASALLLGCVLHTGARGAVRAKYGIQGSGCGDCLAVACCSPWALAQAVREVAARQALAAAAAAAGADQARVPSVRKARGGSSAPPWDPEATGDSAHHPWHHDPWQPIQVYRDPERERSAAAAAAAAEAEAKRSRSRSRRAASDSASGADDAASEASVSAVRLAYGTPPRSGTAMLHPLPPPPLPAAAAAGVQSPGSSMDGRSWASVSRKRVVPQPYGGGEELLSASDVGDEGWAPPPPGERAEGWEPSATTGGGDGSRGGRARNGSGGGSRSPSVSAGGEVTAGMASPRRPKSLSSQGGGGPSQSSNRFARNPSRFGLTATGERPAVAFPPDAVLQDAPSPASMSRSVSRSAKSGGAMKRGGSGMSRVFSRRSAPGGEAEAEAVRADDPVQAAAAAAKVVAPEAALEFYCSAEPAPPATLIAPRLSTAGSVGGGGAGGFAAAATAALVASYFRPRGLGHGQGQGQGQGQASPPPQWAKASGADSGGRGLSVNGGVTPGDGGTGLQPRGSLPGARDED